MIKKVFFISLSFLLPAVVRAKVKEPDLSKDKGIELGDVVVVLWVLFFIGLPIYYFVRKRSF